jgi:hypothetical protein
MDPLPNPGEDEVVVMTTTEPDSLGRQRFFAFWKATDATRLGQTRGQIFFTQLADFTVRQEERGKHVVVRPLEP